MKIESLMMLVGTRGRFSIWFTHDQLGIKPLSNFFVRMISSSTDENDACSTNPGSTACVCPSGYSGTPCRGMWAIKLIDGSHFPLGSLV